VEEFGSKTVYKEHYIEKIFLITYQIMLAEVAAIFERKKEGNTRQTKVSTRIHRSLRMKKFPWFVFIHRVIIKFYLWNGVVHK
jgi:hypothetical protein